MTRRGDDVVMTSLRRWFDRNSETEDNPFLMDGYGQLAATGGQTLLDGMCADVRKKLDLSNATTVLEVGCGAGAITRGVAPFAARTFGVDFSHGMVRRARALLIPRAAFIAGDATLLPHPDACFDRVLCYSVFNNFASVAYARAALNELVRVTRPGGLVLIGQVPNADREAQWQIAYAQRFGGRRSLPRRLLGSVKARAVRLARTLAAWSGHPPPPAMSVRYYKSSFFEAAVAQLGHHCSILPAYDLLQPPGGVLQYDTRLDIVIKVGPRQSSKT